MTGLLKTLTENRVFNHLRNLRLVEKLLIQGLILAIVLVVVQTQLDGARQSFMSYMPPIGFVIFNAYNIPCSADTDWCLKHLHHKYTLQNQRLASRLLAKRNIPAACILNSQPCSANFTKLIFCLYVAAIDIVVLAFTFRLYSTIQQRWMEKTHRLIALLVRTTKKTANTFSTLFKKRKEIFFNLILCYIANVIGL